MARTLGVLNDFANHVTSGLSGFITDAYDACERNREFALQLTFFPELRISMSSANDKKIVSSVHALRKKFIEILQKQSNVSIDEISKLEVRLDFAPDDSRFQKKRDEMAGCLECYRFSPVYYCIVSLSLSSGWEETVTLQDE